MPDYTYDVFISYRRTKLVLKWVKKYFREEFVGWLHEARGVAPRVFWDEEEIGAGDDFNETLKEALLRSKCLVAVLSPSYFRESRWCVSEFRTFRQRSDKLGLKVPGLVVPALWQPWDHFPADVTATFLHHPSAGQCRPTPLMVWGPLKNSISVLSPVTNVQPGPALNFSAKSRVEALLQMSSH